MKELNVTVGLLPTEERLWEDEEDWTEIRYRVRDPEGFQEGSFRRKTIKTDKPRVIGVFGRLKDEDALTLQSLRFPKDDGWTLAKAKEWVKDHPDIEKDSLSFHSRNNEIEHRIFSLTEIRIDGENGKRKIVGHAAVFNQLSEEMWGFKEKISPGAFKKTIKEADVRALFNHDPNYVLGRNKSGTLSLAEDEKGLAVEIDPPATDWARDLMESMRRGDVDQMSFAFQVMAGRDEWHEEDGVLIRIIKEVRLFDVSVVTFPAYPQTDAQVRAQSLLDDIGLDFRALSRILLKANHDLPAAPADQEYLKYAVDLLSRYLPVAPGQVAHPTDKEPPEDAVTAPVVDHPVIDISTLRNRMAMTARVM